MSLIARTLKDLMACRSGASAIEYGLIVVLISLGISGAAVELGVSTSNLFESTDEELQAAVGANGNNRNNDNKNNQGNGQGAGAN